jgi:ribosomal protein S1
MRLQLENVQVGDTVVGVVQQVVSAGILVSVNSLGPLNVTGLIAKKDLPKQFEVPADLKESFQKQLLEQDFVVGREITCGVLQVNPNIGTKVTYNLKMLFEELGPLAADKEAISDSGDRDTDSEDSDDEDTVSPETEVFDDSDLKEIFDELRGSKALLSVADLKAWGDVQDMMEGGIIDNNQLDGKHIYELFELFKYIDEYDII